jgi:hypothetical protein
MATSVLPAWSIGVYGSLASIAGLIVSFIGFGVTVWNVRRSRRAAQSAERASEQVLERVRFYDLMTDVARAITLMDEIKRLHRLGDWKLVIERYGELKKILITVRDTPLGLTDDQIANLRDAIVNVGHMEKTVERTLEDSTEFPPVGQMNTVMANNVESLQELLVAIRQTDGGRHASR